MDSFVEGDGVKRRLAAHGFSTSALPFPIARFSDQSWSFNSLNMDDMLLSIFADPSSFTLDNGVATADGNRNCTAEEVSWDIPSDGAEGEASGSGESMRTLDDFLAKASAFETETAIMSPVVQFASEVCGNGVTAGGFGINGMSAGDSASDGGTGKRSWTEVEETAAPPDKETQRKQRRMTKNRESAARSRERKQAYTMGLESLMTQLEQDNARLLKEEADLGKERYKQLMVNLIPVTEKRKPSRVLTRVNSTEW